MHTAFPGVLLLMRLEISINKTFIKKWEPPFAAAPKLLISETIPVFDRIYIE